MFETAVVAATGIALLVAVWVLVRRRTLRWGGRVADVPDAPREAEPTAAPGLTLPYSSLDPSAPPKPVGSSSRGGTPESE